MMCPLFIRWQSLHHVGQRWMMYQRSNGWGFIIVVIQISDHHEVALKPTPIQGDVVVELIGGADLLLRMVDNPINREDNNPYLSFFQRFSNNSTTRWAWMARLLPVNLRPTLLRDRNHPDNARKHTNRQKNTKTTHRSNQSEQGIRDGKKRGERE